MVAIKKICFEDNICGGMDVKVVNKKNNDKKWIFLREKFEILVFGYKTPFWIKILVKI